MWIVSAPLLLTSAATDSAFTDTLGLRTTIYCFEIFSSDVAPFIESGCINGLALALSLSPMFDGCCRGDGAGPLIPISDPVIVGRGSEVDNCTDGGLPSLDIKALAF